MAQQLNLLLGADKGNLLSLWHYPLNSALIPGLEWRFWPQKDIFEKRYICASNIHMPLRWSFHLLTGCCPNGMRLRRCQSPRGVIYFLSCKVATYLGFYPRPWETNRDLGSPTPNMWPLSRLVVFFCEITPRGDRHRLHFPCSVLSNDKTFWAHKGIWATAC